MKKISFKSNFIPKNATEEGFIQVGEKVNEIIDHIHAIENDLEMIHWNSPKKLEVKHQDDEIDEYFDNFHKYWGKDTQNVFCYSDKENEIIKSCLLYARHRLTQHHSSGLVNVINKKDLIKLCEKI